MQVGVGIDYDQLTDTVYWSDIRYSVSIYHVQVYVTMHRSTTGALARAQKEVLPTM